MTIEEVLGKDNEFKYQLLGRMQSDIPYYLATKDAKSLWALSPKNQIDYMRAIYKSFSKSEKPEWITLGDIAAYARQMGVGGRSKRG